MNFPLRKSAVPIPALMLAFLLWAHFGLSGVKAQYNGPYPITLRHADTTAYAGSLMQGFRGALHFRITEHAMPIDAYRMVEDARGTFWVATQNGLLRMDGDRHRVYRHARRDTLSLPNNNVTDVALDAQGNVWVGTQDGLARLDVGTGKFKTYRNGPEHGNAVMANRFWRVFATVDGSVWTMTETGLFVLEPGTGELMAVVHEEGDVNVFGPGQAYAYGIDPMPDGEHLLITSLHGNYVIHLASRRADRLSLWSHPGKALRKPDHPVMVMPDGSLWSYSGTDETLQHWHPERGMLGSWHELAGAPIAGMGRMMGITAGGEIMLGLWDGRLLVLDPVTGRSARVLLPGNTSTPGDVVPKSTMVDSKGRTWICSKNGLYALLPADPRITHRAMPAHWSRKSPFIVEVMPNGHIALGKSNMGLVHLDPFAGQWSIWPAALVAKNRRTEHIVCMARTAEGSLLVGTYNGVMEADPQTRSLKRPAWYANAPDVLERAIITGLAYQEDGSLWMSTWHTGVFRRDGRTGAFTHYSHDPEVAHSLPIDRILCLHVDRAGTLWVGANDGGGIVRYDPALDGFVPPPAPDGDPNGAFHGVVRCIAERQDGRLWIGTHHNGLHLLDPQSGAFSSFDLTDGIPGDLIHEVIEHPRHGIWVAGSAGVAHTNDPALGFKRIELGFEPSGDEIHLALDTVAERLVITHRSDLVLLDLSQGAPEAAGPRVSLIDMRVNGSAVTAGDAPLRLQRGRDRLAVEFGVQDPIHARDTRVGYRMLGLDQEWDDCLGCRSLNYGDLGTGAYRLEMRTMGPDGNWGPVQRIVELSVHPPFFSTWWFRTGMGALLVLVIMSVSRVHLQRKLEAQRVVFEREQAILSERMRIASDMHDDLGAGLSALKLRSEMAVRSEADPRKRDQLAGLAKTAGELIGSMRQIIWTMDGGQGSLEDLVIYGTNYARSYLSENGIACSVQLPEAWPEVQLSAKQRRDLMLVMKEALHNIVKHAGARSVTIEAVVEDGFRLTIADDGRGLATRTESVHGNGLRNMRMRVEAMGGTFMADGTQGTRINIRIAFGMASGKAGMQGAGARSEVPVPRNEGAGAGAKGGRGSLDQLIPNES